MKSNEKIAFFDSGVGGLSVLNKFKKILPNENCIYFGDLKNIPYGEKSKDELIKIADKVFRFLESLNVKAVVMACNTTSANTFDTLKNNYNFKIYPIIQSSAKIISELNIKRIGVLATNATINSCAYSKELKKYNPNIEVFEKACPPWVQIVESNGQNNEENKVIIKKYLDEILKYKPEKIILGCTHYPFLLNTLSKYAPKEIFIDPAIYFADFIMQDLTKLDLINKQNKEGTDEFFVSSTPKNFQIAAKMFYNLKEE